MSSLTLQGKSALASALDKSRSAVTLEVVEETSIAHVAARKDKAVDLRAKFLSLYGIELPASARVVRSGALTAVWAGPEQWLVLAPAGNGRDLERELRDPLAGLASVADQSDARTIVRVGGEKARDALAKGIPLDLHGRAFAADDAAITHASHIGVMIWRDDTQENETRFVLACARSYSGSFWHWLTEAAAEFGIQVS